MKGAMSKVLIVLGIIFILGAILWWAIAVSTMVKLPSDVDVENRYKGEVTWYVNPTDYRPLPEGQEMKVSMEVTQRITALAEEFDSSIGLIKETVTLGMQGFQPKASEFVYALDRKTMENVKDDRAYDWDPRNTVDREGSYYPFFPFDTSKDETYSFWKSEIGEGVEAECVNEQEKEGVTVYDFKISCEDKPVVGAFVEGMGLPGETTIEEMKDSLKAMGLDVDAFAALAARVMSAEDLQALNAALGAKIPIEYLWSMEQEISVDPKTGIPVDVYKSAETLSMRVDLSGLSQLQAVLGKYAGDPQMGPAIAQLAGLQSKMGEASKVFSYDYALIQDSIAANAEDAKDGTGRINLIKVYIPWAMLIVGALLLIIGLLVGGGPVPEQAEEE